MTPLPVALSFACRLQNDRCTPEGNVLDSSAYQLAERTTSLYSRNDIYSIIEQYSSTTTK